MPTTKKQKSGTTRPRQNHSRQDDVERLLLLVEELSWVFRSNRGLDFEQALRALRNDVMHNPSEFIGVEDLVSPNPNKHFLVGVLPRLLIDDSLFPTNEDIAQFAETVMHVSIPRFHKKSKYELIGHIVCQTNNLDDKGLSHLVKALSKLVSGGDRIKKLVAERRKDNFEWNTIIQELTETRN
jgi:hypothetical protein